MKYIKPSFTEIKNDNFYEKVGLVAHNCYQVENNANAELFVTKLIGFGHLAMIEHYNYAYKIDSNLYQEVIQLNNRFIIACKDSLGNCYISFSLRPLLENSSNSTIVKLINILPSDVKKLFNAEKYDVSASLLSDDDLKKLEYPIYAKLKFVTLRIVTDRGVTHELVRHRIASYAQESTRYCNYSKNKFGNELTYIEPLDYQEHRLDYDKTFKFIEDEYMNMTNNLHMTPEMARSILPNKIKATIMITANIEEYEKIFELRCAKRAHPDMQEIMNPIKDYFIKEGYING